MHPTLYADSLLAIKNTSCGSQAQLCGCYGRNQSRKICKICSAIDQCGFCSRPIGLAFDDLRSECSRSSRCLVILMIGCNGDDALHTVICNKIHWISRDLIHLEGITKLRVLERTAAEALTLYC